MDKNILLAGVGGQGTILASKIVAGVAERAGLDVKVAEVHGMAQRGGAVVTYLRFGQMVNSPLIAEKEADFLLAFEKLEALRWLSYLKPKGRALVNDQEIYPLPVLTGGTTYPDFQENAQGRTYHLIPAREIAQSLKNPRGINMVLLGFLAKMLTFPEDAWIFEIQKRSGKYADANIACFQAGFKYGT
ncbi:indolepyruvate oxidoreductase subunit beta [Carboxydothermus pertinax]|uniref:Indolepyruvate oxidoreductase subunit beta n=1 Tax=Carboxydothermus pertinax TaxID=870242 RepID=A0A1L8CVD9_9THEO|nr:indolepyruvate oxidoreductase subunit beta [Carboxydothermus pertinax]GAV22861.1 indolepyruvate oxidoreductase subunit beta [Carboxydothermus pertinax]